ncbi:MAG: type and secretion system protein [Acidobacteria bacterium]|nr:type and secretion system protein [Acidobacteriota bacterium]
MRFTGRWVLSILSVVWTGSLAQAAVELLGVRTAVDRQATTFLLRLPARVEYSPTRIGPRLFVVDMTGVQSRSVPESKPVDSPVVDSYRLLPYRGADDQPHLALELTLKADGQVNINETPDGLQVQVLRSSGAAAAAPAASKEAAGSKVSQAEPKAEAGKAAAPVSAPASARRTSVQEISVAQVDASGGLEVEILGDGAMQYRTLQLRQPDRLVLDIPNAVNRIRQRRLDVDTPPLKTVRVAQYTRQPAITRVVMDLDAKVNFEVRPHAKGLVVALGASAAAGASSAPAAGVPVERVRLAVIPSRLAGDRGSAAQARATEESDLEAAEEPASPAGEPVLVASNQPTAVPVPAAPAVLAALAPAPAVILPEPAAPVSVAAPTVPPQDTRVATEPAPAPSDSDASRSAGTVLMAQQAIAPPGSLLVALAAPQAQAQQTYTGEPISVNLKDVDLKDFFRLIHEISGLNIVLDPSVSGAVTLVLDEVPWDQAMDIVMRNNQLERQVSGNVVRIARVATLEAEAKAQLARIQAEAQAAELSQPVQRMTRVLSYAQAETLVPTLKRFLSARGDLVHDARTNMLIVTDTQTKLREIENLLGTLDQRSQQVEIEARIVAASRSFARDIGSQLAASGQSGRVVLGGTGLVGESPILRGTTPPLFIGTPPDPPLPGEPPKFANVAQALAVNLPAVGPTAGTSFLITTPMFALDAILTAAESRGLGKLLSRPKIITQSNVEATVQQGVRIPIQTSINNTITTQFINVTLRLTVTPQITAEGTIFLRADIENTGINPGIARIGGIPALDTQQATTQVLVSNGGTVFFGGVIQTTNNLTEQQVPLLGSIPLIGNLFRRRATSSTTNELLFFITPRIVQS